MVAPSRGRASRDGGTSRPAEQLTPKHKVWLSWKGRFLMGPNYYRFLTAVEDTGTIRGGGAAVGWSYRTCLNRVRRMERVLGHPVLATSRGGVSGGGARLTPEGRRLVRLFGRWQREVARAVAASFARAGGPSAGPMAQKGEPAS